MASKSKKIQKVIDGIRAWNLASPSASSTNSSRVTEIEETLKGEHFKYGSIVQYGFPSDPTCIAYEPVQKLIIIGTSNGSGRILGRPGVDHNFQQPSNSPIIQIIFLVNRGIFLSICADETIHQWNFQTKPPELTHSLQFKRERLTCAHLSSGTNWLYLGTERGNVFFVNVDKFCISGYVINWNKAIDLSQNTHPGSIIQLADCPGDSNKLLIGYSTGFLSLWNLREKNAKIRFKFNESLFGLCWFPDGKKFITCHNNGYLVTWNSRQTQAPLSIDQPHNIEHQIDPKISYEPIKKIVIFTTKTEETITVFSGGTSRLPSQNTETNDSSTSFPSITVMKDKKLTILQMDYPVVDFAQLCEYRYYNSQSEPFGIAILLENDLMVIDLQSPNYPSFENPYPIDLHASPVTCLYYISDCPGDFVAAIYTAKPRTKRQTQNKGNPATSSHEWPINGGQWGSLVNSNSELIISGHADGSVRFWDATGTSLTSLYKFRVSIYLEKFVPCTCNTSSLQNEDNSKSDSTMSTPTLSNSGNISSTTGTQVDDCGRPCGLEHDIINSNVTPSDDKYPLALSFISFCTESRKIMLAGNYFATILSFNKRDVISDVPVLDTAIIYEVQEEAELVSEDYGMNRSSVLPHQPSSLGSCHGQEDKDLRVFIGVKPGLIKWSPGYQPDLVCRLGSYTRDPPSVISAISFNANFGLMSYGNDQGLSVVDFVQKICLLSSGTPDLYGSMDPYSRVSWSPNVKKDDPQISTTDVQNMSNGKDSSAAYGGNTTNNDQVSEVSKNNSNKNQVMTKSELKRAKSQAKTSFQKFWKKLWKFHVYTGHFSRSCSSSTSSLENISCETIKSLTFGETYSRKGESTPKPCLWIGSSLGTVIIVNIILPDLRTTQPVIVSPSGTIHRLRGSILCISFLDSNGDILISKSSGIISNNDQRLPQSISTGSNSSINNKDSPLPNTGKKPTYVSKQSTVSSSSSSMGIVNSPTSATSLQNDSAIENINDGQFAVICSEKNAQVISLPSQSQLYKIKITETSLVLKASVITVKSCPCLVTILANSHLMAFSLPSLRMLMDLDSVLGDNWVENTFCFTNHGLMTYMSSYSEMEKATFSTDLFNNIKSAQGDLYNQREMPSPPKKGFFETLFNNASPLDLDELFGEASSGKASTATATLVTTKMERLQQNSGNAQSEIAKARMAALERGEKLSEAEMRTQEMMDHAKIFSKTASQLAAKYEKKDKRWGLPF